MKKHRSGIFLLAAALVLAAPIRSAAQVTYYNYGGTGDERDSESTYRSGNEDGDSGYGPGAAAQVTEEDDEASLVPGVEEVTLSEQYHEEYGTYEESMAGQFFIYSNVGNGGFSDVPVYVDIPANLTWTMEKDGVRMEYASGQMVGERGTYVLRLSGVVNPELPLSQQTEYKAVFRFRIQDKVPVTEAAGNSASAAEEAAAKAQEILDFYEGTGSGVPGEIGQETEPSADSEERAETASEESISGESAGAQESIPEGTDEEGSGTAEDSGSGTEMDAVGAIVQSYNPVSGRYDITTADGRSFSSSVPEGMTGCAEAVLYLGAETEYALYKDGSMIEYASAVPLKDRGSYRLEMGGSAFHFTVGTYLRETNLYTAPMGMRISEIIFDSEKITPEHERYVRMEEDGVYEILLSGAGNDTIQAVLVRDSVAPEAELKLTKGTASITYLSEDIADVVLIKDGEEPQEFHGTEINSPGNYQLILTDQAGNESSYDFSLSFSLNLYAIFAVALVVLLIVGGIVFVRYTKRNMKVR